MNLHNLMESSNSSAPDQPKDQITKKYATPKIPAAAKIEAPGSKSSAPHDQFFKTCMENTMLRNQFIRKYILDKPYIDTEYSNQLQIDIHSKSLAQISTEFTGSDLSTTRADVVFAWGSDHGAQGKYSSIFHIEHQSSSDASMGYRMMKYRVQLDNANQTCQLQQYHSSFIYPPIMQIVYYTGSINWGDSERCYIKHGPTEDMARCQLGIAGCPPYQLISLRETTDATQLIDKQHPELSLMEYLMKNASPQTPDMLEPWKTLKAQLGDALNMDPALLKSAIVYSTAKMESKERGNFNKRVKELGGKELGEAMTVLTDEQVQAAELKGKIKGAIKTLCEFADSNKAVGDVVRELEHKSFVKTLGRETAEQILTAWRERSSPKDISEELLDQLYTIYQNIQRSSVAGLPGDGTQYQDTDSDDLPYHKSFNKYHADSLDKILSLRLQELEISTDQAQIVSDNYGLSESRDDIGRILQAVNELDSTVKALVPYNIDGKHWVSFIITQDIRMIDSTIDINYIDPENNPIPERLVAAIKVANNSSDVVINISQQEVTEVQKYSNCGPEIIENFMEVLTGARHTQEDAVPHHSRLVEKQLLTNAAAETTSPTDLASAFNDLLISEFRDSDDHAASDVSTLGAGFAESFDVADWVAA